VNKIKTTFAQFRQLKNYNIRILMRDFFATSIGKFKMIKYENPMATA
jgi:hypothetical protein